MQSKAQVVEGAVPSTIAGHVVNPFVAAFMPTQGPAIGEDTAPDWNVVENMHTDHFDWSLPAHRRGTLCGMDAVEEPTRTSLRRVPRWWAGKGPAVTLHSSRSTTDLQRCCPITRRQSPPQAA
ncbi:hypothetical protein XdyCFBP7245_10565 [Xanthomonas dyei]|uniref:Uncharacterized protein n=1 Tax=Xanthomonas dyei TaxID=743699 RepID=A0A2S7C3G0_9XANT|nr:hypothetical protein XdyCFBP7245_10565 [Xanthomonas dyei]